MAEIYPLQRRNMHKINKISIDQVCRSNIKSHSHTSQVMFLMTALHLSIVDHLFENKNSGKDSNREIFQES